MYQNSPVSPELRPLALDNSSSAASRLCWTLRDTLPRCVLLLVRCLLGMFEFNTKAANLVRQPQCAKIGPSTLIDDNLRNRGRLLEETAQSSCYGGGHSLRKARWLRDVPSTSRVSSESNRIPSTTPAAHTYVSSRRCAKRKCPESAQRKV